MSTAQIMGQPRDLQIPDEVVEAFGRLSRHLTEEGHAAFLKDIVGALQRSARLNDVRPVQETLEAWHSTLLFVSEPDYPEFLTEKIDGEPMTVEEIRKDMGLS